MIWVRWFIIRCFENGSDPANIYLFKVNNRIPRKRCEICSLLTIETPERRHWRRSGVSIVNFEHILHLFSSVSTDDFEQVNISWKFIPTLILLETILVHILQYLCKKWKCLPPRKGNLKIYCKSLSLHH